MFSYDNYLKGLKDAASTVGKYGLETAESAIDSSAVGAVGTAIGKVPEKGLAPEDRTLVSWLGPVPIGFQVGTWLGIDNAFARFAVDVIADPTTWMGTLFFSGLTKLGKAAKVAKGLTSAEKVQNVVKVVDFAAKAAEVPHLAQAAREALNTQNIKAFRGAIAEIAKVSPKADPLLETFKSSAFSKNLGAMFELENSFRTSAIKQLEKAGLPLGERMTAMDAIKVEARNQTIGQYEGLAKAAETGKAALLYLRNPFTGTERILVRGTPILGGLEAAGNFAKAAIPLKSFNILGKEAKGVETASALKKTAVDQDIVENTNKAIDEAVRSVSITDQSRSIKELGIPGFGDGDSPFGAGEALLNAGNLGDDLHNRVSISALAGRRVTEAFSHHFAAAGGLKAEGWWERLSDTLRIQTDRRALLGLQSEAFGGYVRSGGNLERINATIDDLTKQLAGREKMSDQHFQRLNSRLSAVKASKEALIKAKGLVTEEQLVLAEKYREYMDKMHISLKAELGEAAPQYVKNYVNAVFRLTKEGEEKFKGMDGIADHVVKAIGWDAEVGTKSVGARKSIQFHRKLPHEALLKLEELGYGKLVSRDPIEAIQMYHASASKAVMENAFLSSLIKLPASHDGQRLLIPIDNLSRASAIDIGEKAKEIAKATDQKAILVKEARNAARAAGPIAERHKRKLQTQIDSASRRIDRMEIDLATAREVAGINYDKGFSFHPHRALKGMAVHPELSAHLKTIIEWPPKGDLGTYWDKAINAAYTVNAFGKKSMLGLSAFHFNALLSGAIFQLGPIRTIGLNEYTQRGAGAGAAVAGVLASGIAGLAGASVGGAVGAGVVGAAAGAFAGAGVGLAKTGRSLIRQDPAMVNRMISHGLTLSTMDATSERFVTETLGRMESNLEGSVIRSPITGLKRFNQVFDRALWDEYFSGAKVAVVSEMYYAALKKGARQTLPGGVMETAIQYEARAMNEAVRFANHTFGGINLRKFMMTPQGQRTMSMILFAPDWTVSNLAVARDVFVNLAPVKRLYVGAMIGGATGAVMGQDFGSAMSGAILGGVAGAASIPFQTMQRGMLTNDGHARIYAARGKGFTERIKAVEEAIDMSAQSNTELANYARKFAMTSLAGLFVSAQLANMAMTGHFTWDNEKGHKEHIQLPWTDDSGRAQYVALGKQFKEPFEWASNPVESFHRKAAFLPKLTMHVVTNRDHFGRPIVGHKDGPLLGTAKQIGYAGSQFTPITLQNVPQIIEGNGSYATTTLSIAGLPTRDGRKARQMSDLYQAGQEMESSAPPGPLGGSS